MKNFLSTPTSLLRTFLLILILIAPLIVPLITPERTYALDKLTKPDLFPMSDSLVVKDGYTSIKVENFGGGPAVISGPAGLMVVFWFRDVSGKDLAGKTVSVPPQTIPVRGIIEVKNPVPIPKDATQLYVNVNATKGSVDEEEQRDFDGYANNTETYQLPLPDLVHDGDKPEIRGEYAYVKVKNGGTAPAVVSGVAGLVVVFEFKDASGKGLRGSTVTIPPQTIPVGGVIEVKNTAPIPPEAKGLYVSLNPTTGSVEESSYDNNKITYPLSLAELPPDLTISGIEQDGNTISVHLKNIGFTLFEGGVNATYFWDDDVLRTSTAPLGTVSLVKDAEDVKDFTVRQPSGVSTLHVTVRGIKPEERTDNNSSEITVPTVYSIEGFEKEDGLVLGGDLASVLGDNDTKSQADLAKDLGLLPDNPLYGLKELGRGIKVGMTFDVEKKIDLQNTIAGERALEVNAVIDNGHATSAIGVINKNASNEEKISDALDGLRKKDPKKADDLAAKIIGDRVVQQTVIDKLKHKLPVDDSVKVDKAQDKALTATGKIIDNVKDGNTVKDALEKSASGKGSPYIPLKHLTAINAVSSHVANANARLVLEQAKERKENHLKNNLLHVDPKQLGTFTGYVEKTTGDEVNTLKALDNMKLIVSDKDVRASLGTAKQNTITKLVGEIKSAKAKDEKAGEIMLSGLKSGSITDLRVLSDLKSKDGSVNTDIQAVKKTAIQNFEKNVNSLKPEEKKKFISDVTKDHLDLTQQAVVNDIKKTLPKSSLGKELDDTLKTEVKTKVAKVKGNKAEYDEFVTGITGDTSDDKEAITAFTAGFDSSFFKDIMRQQLTYMQSFYAGADPETKKFLDEFYFNNPEIKAFYTDFDSAFDQLFSGFDESYSEEENVEEDESEEYESEDDYDAGTTSGCPMIDAPVCGTDGLNYANECEAHDNGAEVAYQGECSDESQVDETSGGEDTSGGDEEVQGASTYKAPLLLEVVRTASFINLLALILL